jgi:hypothetical protein
MSKHDRIQEFLKGRYIATISTENDDGSTHLVSVWYLFQEGRLYVGTNSRSRKARNVLARPRAGLLVDSRVSAKECGASTFGPARIIEGETSKSLNAKVRERYLTTEGERDPGVGPVFTAFDDITIEITPGRWVWWDNTVLDSQVFGGALGAKNYLRRLDG